MIAVSGIRECQRAFLFADRAMSQDLKDALAESAEPVRRDAQALAGTELSHLAPGAPWTRMRVGVARHTAFVAPVERGVKGRGDLPARRGQKFAQPMNERVMGPAFDRNVDAVERRFEQMVDEVITVWEHA